MLNAIFWGLIQGLTEFLPISSSGHLVLIPAIFDQPGPDLATAAMLHLGTLAAVVIYYRTDLAKMAKFDRASRKMITLIVIASIPAAVGAFLFKDQVEDLMENPPVVAVMMVVAGFVMLGTTLLRTGDRRTEEMRPLDSVTIGVAQAFALIPGVSRSGMTIGAGLVRGMQQVEAARFAFLLSIPVIAGAGFLEMVSFIGSGESIPGSTWVGVIVAGISGYLAIAVLIRLLTRVGLGPFGIYCVAFGAISFILV